MNNSQIENIYNKLKLQKMAEFRISGIWLDSEGVITHYAIHTRKKSDENGYVLSRAEKVIQIVQKEIIYYI